MNGHQQHNKQWGADDFRRYHDGSMPQQERHALEKAALEDPFLDDALLGYAYTKTPVEDIAALKQRLQEGKKKILLVWYNRKPVVIFSRVAAVLLLFAGITWVISKNSKTGTEQELASIEEPTTVQQQFPVLQADSVKDITAILPQQDTKSTSPLASVETKKEEIPAATLAAAAPVTAAPVASMMDDEVRAEAAQANAAKAKASVTLASEERMATRKELAGKVAGINVTPIKSVTGRIVDNRGTPVANALIVNRQNNQQLMSDKQGNFSLNATNNIANVNVDVNAFGYESNSVELDTTGNNVVVLKELNEGLSEVVVTSAYEQKRTTRSSMLVKTELLQNIQLTNAAPFNGWDSLNKAASAAINKLRKIQANGKATISFDLDAAGAPGHIVVQANACTACVNELIGFMNHLPPLQKVKKNKKLTMRLQW